MGALKQLARHKGPLGIALGAALVATLLGASGALDRLETPTVDVRFRLERQGPIDPRIQLVEVDQPTIDALGWPVPREYFALLLEAAKSARAKGVLFDIEFVDPAPNPTSDRAFEAALADMPAVLAEELDVPFDQPQGWPRASDGHPPLAALAHAADLAHVQTNNKPDGVVRRVPLFVRSGDRKVPALGLAGARLLAPNLAAPEGDPGRVRYGGRALPVDAYGLVAVDFRPIPQDHRISLLQVLSLLKTDPAELTRRLSDALLVVGYSAVSVGDRGAVPLKTNVPLMDVHAHLVDTLVHGRALRIATTGENFLCALALALLIALGCPRLSATTGALAFVGALAGVAALVGLVFWEGRLELWLVAPSIAGIGSYAGSLVGLRRTNEHQVRQIRAAFEKYVAPSILNRILEDPSALNVAGKQANLAILFSDVQGYTSLSNRLPPEQVLGLLRTYLDVMSRILLEHEATIDKIMGDGILAFFGDPIASENPSVQAVRCGLAMQEAMKSLSQRWAAEGHGELKIRVGIATGTVYVGNIGSSDHLEYTVIGPTVNLAARLESNAPAGGVLVSEDTMRACERHFGFEHVTGLKLKGFGADCEAFLCRGEKGASVADPGRRKSFRQELSGPVRVEVQGRALSGALVDVSAGGIAVRLAEPLPVGGRVALLFGASEGVVSVRANGEVRHAEPDGVVGIAIESAEAGGAAVLRNFLELLADGAPIADRGVVATAAGAFHYELGDDKPRLSRGAPGEIA